MLFLSPGKDGSFSVFCAISQGCIPATTPQAERMRYCHSKQCCTHGQHTAGWVSWLNYEQNLELRWAKERASLYNCICVPQGEEMQRIGFADYSIAYECIPFWLSPLLLNQGNRTGRKSRSHLHPEVGLATPLLADRNVICLKTTNEPSILFFFANLTIQFLRSFLIGRAFSLVILLALLWSFSKWSTSFLKGSVQNWS